MSLFKKKKKEQSPLYYALDDKRARAKEQGKTCFYYGLFEEERDYAAVWAMRHQIWMEISHKTGNVLVYKFSGI